MNPRELAAVLGGLRELQTIYEDFGGWPEEIADVLTDGGTFEALTTEEISELCERLNQ